MDKAYTARTQARLDEFVTLGFGVEADSAFPDIGH